MMIGGFLKVDSALTNPNAPHTVLNILKNEIGKV